MQKRKERNHGRSGKEDLKVPVRGLLHVYPDFQGSGRQISGKELARLLDPKEIKKRLAAACSFDGKEYD